MNGCIAVKKNNHGKTNKIGGTTNNAAKGNAADKYAALGVRCLRCAGVVGGGFVVAVVVAVVVAAVCRC